MSGRSDQDRVIQLLDDAGGALSNLRVKTELNLGDERYERVRTELVEMNLIEKYVCRGGGIRLTQAGEKEVPQADSGLRSAVKKESVLYPHLVKFLQMQAIQDGVRAVICDTHNLRARGKWQNPDVTRIGVDYYRYMRKSRVVVTTYEVKQFPNWDVSVVYESASHHRFSHEAYICLEWPRGERFSLSDPGYRIDEIVRECQRFGIGLYTLEEYYSSFRLHPQLEATPRSPSDDDIEAWLEYVFSRRSREKSEFDILMDELHGKAGTNSLAPA